MNRTREWTLAMWVVGALGLCSLVGLVAGLTDTTPRPWYERYAWWGIASGLTLASARELWWLWRSDPRALRLGLWIGVTWLALAGWGLWLRSYLLLAAIGPAAYLMLMIWRGRKVWRGLSGNPQGSSM